MVTQATQTIDIPTTDSLPVRADLYRPEGPTRGIAVLCHGFKGYRTWGFLPFVADRLRSAGIAALSIDFSHNGVVSPEPDAGASTVAPAAGSRGGRRFRRPDLFARNTIKRECEDLGAVIRFIEDGQLDLRASGPPAISLFGHSRGGVAAILQALERPSLAALCTWSTADNPDFFTPEQKAKWRRDRRIEFTDARDGSPLHVNVEYLDDLEANRETYDLGERVKSLRVPHLIVHGTLDLVVKVDGALALHEAEHTLRDKRLVLIQTGHTFGIPYPFPDDPLKPTRALEEAAAETVAWFTTHFDEGANP